MNQTRRTALASAAAMLLAASTGTAWAAGSWPDHPVRLIVPYPVGGGGDTAARPLGIYLSKKLGQQIVVDNRGGANGNIGMELVAKSPADGYTLVLALTSQLAVNQTLYKQLSYDPAKDFEPIALVASAPYFLALNPKVPAKDLKEFIALAKANPGKYSFGSSGNGSGPHLSMELLKSMAGIDLLHVPFKGTGPAMPALLGGDVDAMFVSYGVGSGQIKAGKLRAIAVSSSKRAPTLPDIPTIAEAGVPGYDSGVWYALLAPKGTPASIVQRINTDINALLKEGDLKKAFLNDGIVPIGSTPEGLATYIKSESTKWADIVRRSGATID
ncbi:tripartite tricarboxylate transporter substrate binding protein [Variovorax sp. J22G73]|nr:tripartite tricarboxylate transporter substrate binding protein [Variovorax sp. J22G73]